MDAAKLIYAKALHGNEDAVNGDDIEKARARASTGFKTLFGPSFSAARHAYVAAR